MVRQTSVRVEGFTESVIREMTRLSQRYGAVNLAQGFPDFDPPAVVKEAAARAVRSGFNQYSTPHGVPDLRRAIARKMRSFNHISCDPDENITVTCGTTEGMMATLLGVLNKGDEVVIPEPFYENYGPGSILAGAKCRYVKLRPPSFEIEDEDLKRAFTSRTKAIIVNTPHNPTGRVFTRNELQLIRDLCIDHDAFAITDEVYEHIIYDGRKHLSVASLDGMKERTVTITGFSKTYSVTGWRVGYVVASKQLTSALRKVHDFLTVCAPTPLQVACQNALKLSESYYHDLRELYRESRTLLLEALEEASFTCTVPEGAYYIWTDIARTGFRDDRKLAEYLVKKIGVGAVPGSSFYHRPADGRLKMRFSFSKKPQTIRKAIARLRRFKRR